MAKLRHIYRSNKLSNIPQKRYARKYNPEYLKEKAAHGVSQKLGIADFDGDGDLDGIYPNQRAGVAEKPGLHINPPRRGPYGLELSLVEPPSIGPSSLTASVEPSSIGPSSLTASVIAPAAGPQSLEASEITAGTSAIVHRFTYEMGDALDYYRTGVADIEFNDGALEVAGITEFARAPYPSEIRYREYNIYKAVWTALSKDGSTYAEVTFRFVSGSSTYVIDIYNKVDGSWQLQSTINTPVYTSALWLNEDGTELLSYGSYDTHNGLGILAYVRYRFTDGEWIIVGPELGKSYFAGRDSTTARVIHVSDDLKHITHCYYYTASGIHDRHIGVVVFEWNDTDSIYETYNDSHESLSTYWSHNIVQFVDMATDEIYEAHFDRDNDVLKIVYIPYEQGDIKVSSYTAETKTFETPNGDREANIWGNDTPLDGRTGETSATHTQTITNSGDLGISMSKDGNHMVTASSVEGYQIFEWNPETMEFDVIASLAWDGRWFYNYNYGRGIQIIDRNNFVVLGSASSRYPVGELYHYRINESDTLEYAGPVVIGKFDGRMSNDWTAVS